MDGVVMKRRGESAVRETEGDGMTRTSSGFGYRSGEMGTWDGWMPGGNLIKSRRTTSQRQKMEGQNGDANPPSAQDIKGKSRPRPSRRNPEMSSPFPLSESHVFLLPLCITPDSSPGAPGPARVGSFKLAPEKVAEIGEFKQDCLGESPLHCPALPPSSTG